MRLFVAIPFEPEVKESLTGLMETWRENGVTGRFTKSANLHLTLAFIGEWDDAEPVKKALSSISWSGFDLSFGKPGRFGSLLWVGTQPEKPAFHLSFQVRAALRKADIPFDKKPFRPHVTLVRQARGWEGKTLSSPLCHFHVSSFTLFSSERNASGLIYRELKRFRAAGGKENTAGKVDNH
jgi:2'-5' RNA ligase